MKSNVSELLLGYDARESWLNFQETWDAERRQNQLLRQEIEKPLSVDSDVWPSVFEAIPCLVRPDWTGYVQHLWDDLEALRRVVEPVVSPEPEKAAFVAVELVS